MVEREVDEVDLVRERADGLMTVAAALATCDILRGCRDVGRDAEGLLEVVGLVEVAVAREDKALRRRLVGNVPWRTWRRVWRPGTPELPRCEGISIHNDRRLAAEALIVDERGRREDVCRARRRLYVATAATTAALIEQDGCARYKLDDRGHGQRDSDGEENESEEYARIKRAGFGRSVFFHMNGVGWIYFMYSFEMR